MMIRKCNCDLTSDIIPLLDVHGVSHLAGCQRSIFKPSYAGVVVISPSLPNKTGEDPRTLEKELSYKKPKV